MSDSSQFRPMARSDGLVAERVDDGVVIYDEHSQSAHYLSGAAAAVWDRCDGELSQSQIGAQLQLTPETVERAVAELVQAGLLEGRSDLHGYSRREAAIRLAQAGGAAFAAPLIYSVAVPASAFATASCVGKTAPNCAAAISKSAADTKDCTCSTSGVCYHSGQGLLGCVTSGCSVQGTAVGAGNLTKCCCNNLTRIGETKCSALAAGNKCSD
jgi:DNA-binding MarR family transcriptional regulator